MQRIMNLAIARVFESVYLKANGEEKAAMKKVFEFVDADDKFNTFNMGFGWVVIVSPDDADKIMSAGNGDMSGVKIGTITDTQGVRVSMAD